MSLKARIVRLEDKFAAICHSASPQHIGVFERIRLYDAYFRGEGPRPPCPPGLDAETRARRNRVFRCFEDRRAGKLRSNEYLPE